MKVTGLLLCGGQSTRMGTDKGLISTDGKTWSQVVAQLFERQTIPYYLSLNASQLESYSKVYATEKFIIDSVSIPGPLRGILSAAAAFPENNWLVLACDMIEMNEATIQNILKKAAENPDFDFWIYKNEEFFEPFCGIYSSEGLKKIAQEYHQGQLQAFSMQHVFLAHRVYACPTENSSAAFKNFNQHPHQSS
ncbi:molybdenum cofactor guanylyltransferase [Pedobacter sp. MW01-1-1]|uniref:molybdenum cofactor guanylyltransferase n=1 Tax=Pedobacter sp. MW01-1-1 TaxID=3383027 RepID=UPI003FF0B139